jgi:hypothetical protein
MSNRITKRNKNTFLVSVAWQLNFKSVIFQSAVRLANHESIYSKLGYFVMKYNLSGYKAHCYYRAELHMIRKEGRRANIAWPLKFMTVGSLQTIV